MAGVKGRVIVSYNQLWCVCPPLLAVLEEGVHVRELLGGHLQEEAVEPLLPLGAVCQDGPLDGRAVQQNKLLVDQRVLLLDVVGYLRVPEEGGVGRGGEERGGGRGEERERGRRRGWGAEGEEGRRGRGGRGEEREWRERGGEGEEGEGRRGRGGRGKGRGGEERKARGGGGEGSGGENNLNVFVLCQGIGICLRASVCRRQRVTRVCQSCRSA